MLYVGGITTLAVSETITTYGDRLFDIGEFMRERIIEGLGGRKTNLSTLHGNSLNTDKLTYGYTLRDMKTGEIVKYGETTQGEGRYTKQYLKEHNLYMQFESSGTKEEMHEW